MFFWRRWSQHILRITQHFRSHNHVLLLHGVRDGSAIPEVHLVEEIPHNFPNGEFDSNKRPRERLIFSFQVQFVAIFSHQLQLLFTECDYPKGFMVWIALHGILFLFLFSDFYKVNYSNGKRSTASNTNVVSCFT